MKHFLLLICIVPILGLAQDDSTANNKKFIKVISIAGYSGANLYADGYEDRTIFQQASPGNPLMFADLSGYSNNGQYYDHPYIASSVSHGLMVSARLRGQKKYAEVRFGLNRSRLLVSNQYYVKQTSTQIGTTTLPGGDILITDSIYNSTYLYKWYTEMIGIDLSWLIKSDPGKIINCYTGIGINLGFGYNGSIVAERRDYSYYSNHTTGSTGVYYSSNYENHIISTTSSASPFIMQYGGYVPIGFNLRLGKRHSFFSHLALFGEFQGGLYYLAPSTGSGKIRSSSNTYGGVRYYIRAPKYTGKNGRRRERGNNASHGEEHLQH